MSAVTLTVSEVFTRGHRLLPRGSQRADPVGARVPTVVFYIYYYTIIFLYYFIFIFIGRLASSQIKGEGESRDIKFSPS